MRLEPKFFGPSLGDTVLGKLQERFEGQCNGQYGYVVFVLTNTAVLTPGVVDPADGFAEFRVKFDAVVCRPMKGEVVDAIVTIVNRLHRHTIVVITVILIVIAITVGIVSIARTAPPTSS